MNQKPPCRGNKKYSRATGFAPVTFGDPKTLFSELGSAFGGNERAGCCQQSLKDQG
jgi:hypothetical protein